MSTTKKIFAAIEKKDMFALSEAFEQILEKKIDSIRKTISETEAKNLMSENDSDKKLKELEKEFEESKKELEEEYNKTLKEEDTDKDLVKKEYKEKLEELEKEFEESKKELEGDIEENIENFGDKKAPPFKKKK